MTRPAQAGPRALRVDAARYLSAGRPVRLVDELDLEIDERCFLPQVEDLPADWVSYVAVPSFRSLRLRRGGGPIDAFCTIGTGAGLDALAAIEVLGARRVGLTDVHEAVVAAAVRNVRRNLRPGVTVEIEAGHGDLLEPLRPLGARYDVIYENLPNVQATTAEEVAVSRTSSTHVAPRAEPVPPEVRRQMLDLHYLALHQAADFLAPGGSIVSMLGVRVPLEILLALGRVAGLVPSFLRYGWKIQAEGDTVIRDLAALQRKGFGPYHFYPADVLRARFAVIDPEAAGARALEIERQLTRDRLDAEAAWEAFRRGVVIGHTAVALETVLP